MGIAMHGWSSYIVSYATWSNFQIHKSGPWCFWLDYGYENLPVKGHAEIETQRGHLHLIVAFPDKVVFHHYYLLLIVAFSLITHTSAKCLTPSLGAKNDTLRSKNDFLSYQQVGLRSLHPCHFCSRNINQELAKVDSKLFYIKEYFCFSYYSCCMHIRLFSL